MGANLSTLLASLNGDSPASALLRARIGGSVAVIAIVYLLRRYSRRSAPQSHIPAPPSQSSRDRMASAGNEFGVLDIRRKCQIGYGRAMDHAGDVIEQHMKRFDLNKTIFHTVESPFARMFLKHRLSVDLYWSDKAIQRVQTAYSTSMALSPPPQVSRPLLEFMYSECNFSMEHADGSFMDHLQFCYEYSSKHYPSQSPRVLLLHSIMGVGTNFFPMDKSKLPHLKSLLTADEYVHIQAFPSFVRLLNVKTLLQELSRMEAPKLEKLKKIEFHRVLDNEKISLTAEELWIQLNFHLIHALDFLPAANWRRNLDDNFLSNFLDLHQLLKSTNKLVAHVDVDLNSFEDGPETRPMTLAGFIKGLVPGRVIRRTAIQTQAKFSQRIGHSLDYQLIFA